MGLPTEPKDERDQGRKAKEVSDDIQDANTTADGTPEPPEPKKKTPQELLQDPAKSVDESEVTGE